MDAILAAASTVGASSLWHRWVIQHPSGGSGGALVSLSPADVYSYCLNALLPLVHFGRNAIVDGVLSSPPSPLPPTPYSLAAPWLYNQLPFHHP